VRLKSSHRAGHSFPLRHCADSMNVSGEGGAPVGRDEVISDCRKDRDELLQSTGGSKALHHPFAFPQWEVGIFCAIVQPFMRSVFDGRHEIPLCRSI
jgi:hypothetical protein